MDDLLTTNRLSLCPSGAHLTSTDTTLGELFYVSSKTSHGVGHAIRGGVPLIAPWFGDLWGKKPHHGWARTSGWRVTADVVGINATLEHDELELTFHVTELPDGVRLELSAKNLSSATVPVQLGFHPYFRVSHPEAVTVKGLSGATGLNRVTDKTAVQEGDVHVEGQFDWIFTSSAPATIIDPGLGRSITITSEGADSTIVWNPGPIDGASIADMGSGEWADFLCVEPALLGDELKGYPLAPDAEVRIAMDVVVAALD
ncbi:Putative glucose-6-phosphate 1-epimerase [Corynebacterium atrinae]|uniref:aldose epimerase family protein n=1 Tax=Corynebacterium atrinae TaxID=1336740 RepID=UPI0025B31712|nr:D-hexose-6-phosphate mutarotase [Corynebacterium atrinae]WJY63972.1 Putative glucose-6-phosphate 1-epimerase [Corynebacterium atrinae]